MQKELQVFLEITEVVSKSRFDWDGIFSPYLKAKVGNKSHAMRIMSVSTSFLQANR